MNRLLPLLIALLVVVGGAAYFLDRGARDRADAVKVERDEALDGTQAQQAASELAVPRTVGAKTPTSSVDERETVRVDDHELTDWIDGTVQIPEGAPAEELGVWVLAGEEPLSASRWDLLIAESSVGLRRVTVEDGRFRFRATRGKPTRLWLDSEWLYIPREVIITSSEPATLVAFLGAALEFELHAPNAAPDDQSLAGIPCSLEGSVVSAEPQTPVGGHARRSGMLDAQGRVKFRGLPAHLEWKLTAEPERWATLHSESIELSAGTTARHSLTFELGARLAGFVVDTSGAPIAGAEVTWGEPWRGPDDSSIVERVQADEGGRFAMYGLTPQTGSLMGISSDHLSTGFEALRLQDRDMLENLELRLPRSFGVTGRVLMPDGQPAEGAKVIVHHDSTSTKVSDGRSWGMSGGETVSAADGTFHVGGMFDGKCDVYAKRTEADGVSLRASIEQVPTGTETLELKLAHPCGLSVRLVSSSGVVISNAEVRAEPHQPSSGMQFAPGGLNDAEHSGLYSNAGDAVGIYRFPTAWEGFFEIGVVAEGYVQVEQPLIVANDGSTVFDVELATSSQVSGVVLDPDGAPVRNAEVSIQDPSDRNYGTSIFALGFSSKADRTGADGRFRISDIKAGSFIVVATHDQWADSEPIDVILSAGSSRNDLTIQLRRAGAIQGVILDDAGRPEPGRSVTAMDLSSMRGVEQTSDANGEFRFEGLTPGTFQVVAHAELDDSSELTFAEQMTRQQFVNTSVSEGEVSEVVLGSPAGSRTRVHGRVTRSGVTIHEGIVLVLSGLDSSDGFAAADVGADGTYSVEVSAQEEARVAYMRDPEVGISFDVIVEIPAADEWRFDVQLPEGSIHGRVINSQGDPAGMLAVSLASGLDALGRTGPAIQRSAMTKPDGTFRFDDLEPGSYDLRIRPYAFLFASPKDVAPYLQTGIEIDEASPTRELSIQLEAPGTIEGRVIDANGNPVTGATIFVRDERGVLLWTDSDLVTDTNGRFHDARLPPGKFTLEARAYRAACKPIPVRVTATSKEAVELRLVAATTLLVTLKGTAGIPIRAGLSVTDESGREMSHMRSPADSQLTQDEGNDSALRVGPLPPGKYLVVAVDSEGRRETQSVTLDGQPEHALKLRVSGK